MNASVTGYIFTKADGIKPYTVYMVTVRGKTEHPQWGYEKKNFESTPPTSKLQ